MTLTNNQYTNQLNLTKLNWLTDDASWLLIRSVETLLHTYLPGLTYRYT